MGLNKKGLTYISVLAVFLLLAVSSWNLFYFIRNYNLQLKYLTENRLIFYKCQNLAKEAIFFPEGRQQVTLEEVSYQIETKREGQLVKVLVLASKEGEVLIEAGKSKFFPAEKEIEEDIAYEEEA